MGIAKPPAEERDDRSIEGEEDDRRDLEAAVRAEAEAKAAGEEPTPLEQVRSELGL